MRLSWIPVLGGLIVIAIQAASWLVTLDGAGWHDAAMVGVDANMRMMRVLHWLESGGWFAKAFPFSNAPFGEVLHWTRPLDVLLIALAAPLALILGWEPALHAVGVIIGPLALVATVGLYHRLLGSAVAGPAFLILAALVAVQPVIHNYYSFARPDHHGLLGLLFVATFFGALKAYQNPEDQRIGLLAGVAAGLAIWVSAEGLLGLTLACSGLGIIWLLEGGRAVTVLIRVLQGALVAVCLALVIERPSPEWDLAELDRISVVHVVFIAAFAGLWTVMLRLVALDKGPLSKRLFFGVIGLAMPLTLVVSLFPKVLGGPTADVDPEVMAIWFSRINEVQPLGFSDAEALGRAAYMLIPLLWGLGFILWRIKKAGRDDRPGLLFLLLGLTVTLALGVFQVRWLIYAGLIGVVPLTLLLLAIWRWDGRWRAIPLRAPVFLIVITSHLIVAAGFFLNQQQTEPRAEADRVPETCNWQRMAAHLPGRDDRRADGGRYVLFSTVHVGPALLYRTRQSIVGSPYHRNTDGILDSHRVLSASGPLERLQARTILMARDVDYMVICLHDKEAKHYAEKEPQTLIGAMQDRKEPDWLSPMPLPDDLRDSFRLYHLGENRGG